MGLCRSKIAIINDELFVHLNFCVPDARSRYTQAQV